MTTSQLAEGAAPVDRDRALVDAALRDASRIAAGSSALASLGVISHPPPDQFPGYDIVEEIHRGAQGVVYRAVQHRTQRHVAIKVLRGGPFAGRHAHQRFDREIQILARLKHPNIVTIHDSGLTGDCLYFIMDYIPGRPPNEYATASGLSIPDILALFAKICRAVNAAHLHGVIHRDLKPHNIRVDKHGEPHILDFGLAKTMWHSGPPLSPSSWHSGPPLSPSSWHSGPPLSPPSWHGGPPLSPSSWHSGPPLSSQPGAAEPQTMTETGQFIGSLPWASPEQAEGLDTVDLRTDVYSLGVILYQMLTNKFPYPKSRNTREMLANIADTDPLRPGINNEVDTIVLKCLAKDPDRRYQSAGELAHDVERYLAGEPIEAKRDSAAYVLRKQLIKHKLPVAVAAAFLMVIFAGLAASLTFWRQAVGQRDTAETARQAEAEQRRIAATRAEETKQVADFQAEMLSGLDLAEMAATLRDDLIAEIRLAKKTSGLPPEQIESEIAALNGALNGANLTNVALNSVDAHILRPALSAIHDRFADNPTVQATLLQTVAETYFTLGLYDAAFPPVREALKIRRRSLGEDHPDTLNSLSNLGAMLSADGKLDEAETQLRDALARGRRSLGEDHLETLFSMHALGLVLHRKGKRDEAEQLFRSALQGRRRVLGDDDQETVSSINYLATFLLEAGKYAEAEPLLTEALERSRRVFGPKHSFTLMAINSMGVMLRNQGRLEEAEPYLREVVQLCRETLGDEHPGTGSTIYNLAKLFEMQGKYAEAERVFREALERARATGGDDRPATINWIFHLGDLLETAGNLSESETCFREVVERRRRVIGPDKKPTLEAMHALARVLAAAGRPAEAEPLYREALSGLEPLLGPLNRGAANCRLEHGQVLTALMRFAEAEQQLLTLEKTLREAGRSASDGYRSTLDELIRVHEGWHADQPDAGHDAKATEWRSKAAAAKPADK